MSLVFYNNVLSSVGLVPFVIFSGELAGLRDLLSQGGEHLTTLIWGTLLTGFFGFMLNLAGFLQIKVTSPITHMISSALRGVLQTVIAVWLFGDIVTAQRVVGIAFILAGSSYYTWVRSVEMEQEKGGRK
jgi:GDP-fucose transporter C1